MVKNLRLASSMIAGFAGVVLLLAFVGIWGICSMGMIDDRLAEIDGALVHSVVGMK